jgi:hypothetical protein
MIAADPIRQLPRELYIESRVDRHNPLEEMHRLVPGFSWIGKVIEKYLLLAQHQNTEKAVRVRLLARCHLPHGGHHEQIGRFIRQAADQLCGYRVYVEFLDGAIEVCIDQPLINIHEFRPLFIAIGYRRKRRRSLIGGKLSRAG